MQTLSSPWPTQRATSAFGAQIHACKKQRDEKVLCKWVCSNGRILAQEQPDSPVKTPDGVVAVAIVLHVDKREPCTHPHWY